MPSHKKSSIIVLHLTKWGDHGAIVHAIDSEKGRCGFILRKLGKAATAQTSLFHPLSCLDVVTQPNSKSSLETIIEFVPRYRLDSVRCDMGKSCIALFISEVLYRSIREGMQDKKFYDWLEATALSLEQATGNVANFHLWFLVNLSSHLGFLPQDNWSESAPIFSIPAASFTNSWPADGRSDLFSLQNSEILHNLLHMQRDQAMALPLSGAKRIDFSKNMIHFLEYHLSSTINVKSLDVLHDIFL